MLRLRLTLLLILPYVMSSLTLDQKVCLKLIESLWKEGSFAQAEEEIDRFLTRYPQLETDESLFKLKSDLFIKKKNYKDALDLINRIQDSSDFVKERKLLCLYELKMWPEFLDAFERDHSLKKLVFGSKIWDLGLAEAIKSEQNLERKKLLIDKASHLYSQDLEEAFDQNKALSLALLYEDQKDYQKAYATYQELYLNTKDEAYELAQARMLSHFDVAKSVDILETLRWKAGDLGTQAGLFMMQVLDKQEDFHKLYHVTLEELRLAPEGYRKAKIALYHLKSLFYLKCFDRIDNFYFTYNPHQILKSADQILSVTLMTKAYLIKNEPAKAQAFYEKLKDEKNKLDLTCGRLLAKHFIEKNDYANAKLLLEELLVKDLLHKDEYKLILGFCFLKTETFELAEKYFLEVLESSPDQNAHKKAISYLLDLPKLSKQSLCFLVDHQNVLNLKESPNALFWLLEGLKQEEKHEAALGYLKTYADPNSYFYNKTLAELKEKENPAESLKHYQNALDLADTDLKRAYIHNRLFTGFFDHDKEKAASHLFSSISLYPSAIEDKAFKGLVSYFYQKTNLGIRLHLKDEKAQEAASNLLRLISYKSDLSVDESILYAKTLLKLNRFEEAFQLLKNAKEFNEQIELVKVLNHQGLYRECDELLAKMIHEKPYSLYQEGQTLLFTKICLEFQRLKAQTEVQKTKEDLLKELKILEVCIQDPNSELAFEVQLFKNLFFSKEDNSLEALQAHSFLQTPASASQRKILNFIVNNKIDRDAALSIDEPISDFMQFILIQVFGDVRCL